MPLSDLLRALLRRKGANGGSGPVNAAVALLKRAHDMIVRAEDTIIGQDIRIAALQERIASVPGARITAIDTTAARALPGVHLVLTHHDAPATRFSTARHELRTDDPDDTRILDDTVRFVGQRVAAVVADTPAIAEHACRLITVEYEPLPAVFDPELAMEPGAPLLHDKGGVIHYAKTYDEHLRNKKKYLP